MPAITINASGFVLDGPLVAGEPATVSVSGLSLAAGASLSLTCTARFPDALLASVALTQGDGGAWGGTLDTATKQAALYFLTARADEARAVVLELVDTANRDSIARVSAPMLNSSLLPKPDKAEGASPLMIPGPPGPQGEQGATGETGPQGPQGPKGDPQTPSDATPQMDGAGAAGSATTYARGDHQHPTDTSRMAATANGNTILTGGMAWNGAPIGVFADQITASVATRAKIEQLAAKYSESGSYESGDVVSYIESIYVCTASTQSPAGEFDINLWRPVDVASLLDGKLDATKRNMLNYTNGTTLAPGTAVYRSSLNADGTFPTITDTGIPTAAAYYQFELEMTVPSTVPSTITGPSGWTWLDGHGLPDPADLSGGETICISVRLDCTAHTFLASVWRAA